MRKLFAFMAISADGYHATLDRDPSWQTFGREFADYSVEQLDEVDTLVFGRTTYEELAAYWTGALGVDFDPRIAERMNRLAKLVVSDTLESVSWLSSPIELTSVEALANFKRTPGQDAAILGSSTLAGALLRAGLVDEVRLMVNPIILGGGLKVFEGGPAVALELTRCAHSHRATSCCTSAPQAERLRLPLSNLARLGIRGTTDAAGQYRPHTRLRGHRHPALARNNGRRPVSTTTSTGAVRSSDGTEIAYERSGAGRAVVIIGAGPTDRSANAPVAELLAARFSVFNYDRRARGGSGDTPPFTVDREYDDLAAVIKVAGGTACIFGSSGGAVIALEAAARGLGVAKLGLWEPPYVLDSEDVRPPADYEAQLASAVTEDRAGDAVELFFTKAAGVPAEFVAPMRDQPFWPAMEHLAQALVYDAAILGDFRPPAERLARVAVPTLVVDGGTTPWMSRAAEAVAELVTDAQRRTLSGQPHNVDATAIAPVLIDFFAA